MNMQKYIIASVAVAVWFFLYGFLTWGLLLGDYLNSLAPAGAFLGEESQNMVLIAVGCLIEALGLGLLYTKGHEGKGAMEGVRFGFYVAVFFLGVYVLMSGVTPYSMQTSLTYWAVDAVMFMSGGALFALLYKK